MEHGVYADSIIIHPKPCSIYLRGTIHGLFAVVVFFNLGLVLMGFGGLAVTRTQAFTARLWQVDTVQ